MFVGLYAPFNRILVLPLSFGSIQRKVFDKGGQSRYNLLAIAICLSIPPALFTGRKRIFVCTYLQCLDESKRHVQGVPGSGHLPQNPKGWFMCRSFIHIFMLSFLARICIRRQLLNMADGSHQQKVYFVLKNYSLISQQVSTTISPCPIPPASKSAPRRFCPRRIRPGVTFHD